MSLNDYEILKQIGAGAFSTVSLVKCKKDNSIYALKRVELNKMMPNEKDNSLNEIRLLASVNHINIISYKESFYEETTNTLNLVLEYADAGDLQSKISAHKSVQKYFSEKTIWSIFIQMVRGIKALHDKNIIHRDLKSANIFLMKNGICKLGDLNVSKEAKTGLLKTQTGTPYFASPEVWNGKPYGLKSDIWSLGCILYQMTTLKMPFQGSNFKEVYNNVLKCKYSPLPKMYSQDLDMIIKKLLQIDPDKRPSAKEILEETIIKEKSKILFCDKEKEIKTVEKDNSFILKNINNEFKENIEINNHNAKTQIKLNNISGRLLKTSNIKERNNMKEKLPMNKGFKISNNNNYRIFKNYDTNPSVNKEENPEESNNKISNEKLINKKFYNKSSINKFKKYKTINFYFVKAKSNLQEKLDKPDTINKNCTLNINFTLDNKYKLTKQTTSPFINHISEGNSININNKHENRNEIKNKNQVKIPFLNPKNKSEKHKNCIPRNCISAKTRKKALSENRPNKYYDSISNEKINIQSPSNYQYKKILPLNTNLNNEANNANTNNNMNQKKRLTGIGGYGYEFSQTDIDNKETTNTTAGKSIIYGKNVENKLYFNLSSKQKEKHFHSLSKIKKSKNFIEDNNENLYNKNYIKSIPRGKNNKNISTLGFEGNPVKPNLKISNLFKEFDEVTSKLDTNNKNKFENSFHYTLNKNNVKRNKSTFEFKNEDRKKVMTLHQISSKKNYSQNGLDVDLNYINKNNFKYTVTGAKLSLPNKKFHNHKKLFKKSINNFKILENINNNKNSNYKYNNTSSNRANAYRIKNSTKNNRSNFSLTKKENDNMHKSISLATMEKPVIYNTQSNKNNHNPKKKKYSNNLNREDSNSFNKKITSFKFDDFKTKRLKKSNYNTNDRKKMAIKFHHIPFIKTMDKEKERDIIIEKEKEKEKENQFLNENKNIDPTIKMLINPIKIVEKKSFKRKLFPVHPHIKLNKLNLLNNVSNKNTNQGIEISVPNEI